jgi:hypothetical protein
MWPRTGLLVLNLLILLLLAAGPAGAYRFHLAACGAMAIIVLWARGR